MKMRIIELYWEDGKEFLLTNVPRKIIDEIVDNLRLNEYNDFSIRQFTNKVIKRGYKIKHYKPKDSILVNCY